MSRDVVHQTVGDGEEDADLAGGTGAYCGCLSSSDARPRSSGARCRVEVAGAELGEGRQLAELGQLELQRAGDLFMAVVWAEPPTRDTERPTLIAGRIPALKRSASRKIWPSVIEMTFVGM